MIGLDIGGANLKAANGSGLCASVPFALWKAPDRLAAALKAVLEQFPSEQLVVTMTGELCDCYSSKREGVCRILDAVETVSAKPFRVWSTEGAFVTPAEAKEKPLRVGAGNWHALATWAGRLVPTVCSILIDIGSTTTDMIPLENGIPVPQGLTDPERMRSGELVYTGVSRTPVCAILGMEVAAEFFATMHDVYLILNQTPERPDCLATADGQPATVEQAHARLARMLCADLETSTAEERVTLARRAAEAQAQTLRASMIRVKERLPTVLKTVILSGSGEFVAKDPVPVECQVISLGETLGEELSAVACAYALAVLGEER